MPAERPFASLNTEEVRRLMQLAIEVGIGTEGVSPLLLRACAALAAEFGFELWFREQARLQVRRTCGRSFGQGRLPRRASGH